jgi:signal transduction histidine kinase
LVEEKNTNNDPQISEISELLDDVEANLKKINEHGNRADSIVKSMLQHSRGGNNEKAPVELNALAEEYVNLCFHGMRAGEKPIDVDVETDFDESIEEVQLVGEDFSRVIVNLCNNAFDAMWEKLQDTEDYQPKLTVRTQQQAGNIVLEVKDNGPGIPEDLKDQVLTPFYTTKKGTNGTGLGLSITSDIVKVHGGTIDIQSEPGQYTIFRIRIPRNYSS